jgi:hypothetical protein
VLFCKVFGDDQKFSMTTWAVMLSDWLKIKKIISEIEIFQQIIFEKYKMQ